MPLRLALEQRIKTPRPPETMLNWERNEITSTTKHKRCQSPAMNSVAQRPEQD